MGSSPCGRLLAAFLLAGLAAAGDAPDPLAIAEGMTKYGPFHSTTGEQFTWHAATKSHSFLSNYTATKNPAWLEGAVKFYDWCNAKIISNDPDGYPGTFGADINTSIDKTEVVADTVVGDANIALPLVEFAELVRADPALQERFGAKADEYIALATRMCWEKWNKRGCYYQDSLGYGSYHTYEKAVDKADRAKWVPRTAPYISDNLNKHYKIGLVILHLWRLTGRTEYRDRVIAVYSRAKAMFRLLPDEDRIVWNFWMPHGAYDIEGTSPRSWVGVHPERPGYQAFEAGAFLKVYDNGLVFDKTDMQRIVRTNVWMIDNGLKSADGTSKAGAVWGSLARFDEKIRAAASKGKKKKVVEADEPDEGDGTDKAAADPYARREVTDPKAILVSDIPVQPGRRMNAALAVPEVVDLANDTRIRLLCRVMEAGTVVVELLSADGKEVLGQLFSEAVNPKGGAFSAPRWDGTNPKTGRKEPGRFLVRWTLNGESRTWPVEVIQGVAQPKQEGTAAIAAGTRLSYDFEQPLDARWTLVGGAEVAGEQVKGGAKALRIAAKQSAALRFGGQDDLPVRIAFAAFDGGAKHGKKNGNGLALCVKTADGNLFAIRQVWRGYLSGDSDWAWVNNGENQWFSPHPAKLPRAEGWNLWTFDLTTGTAVIERDGQRIAAEILNSPRFVPHKGGVGLEFMGPSDRADAPLWIDDLTIEYPAKP